MKQRGVPYEVRLFAGKTDPMNSGFLLPPRMFAAALDAPAGYGGYYGISGAEVAAG